MNSEVVAQNALNLSGNISWEIKTIDQVDGSLKFFYFEGAYFPDASTTMPCLAVKLEVPEGFEPANFLVQNSQWADMPSEGWEILGNGGQSDNGNLSEIRKFTERGKSFYVLYLSAHKPDPSTGMKLLSSYNIKVFLKSQVSEARLNAVTNWAENSVLASGNWLRVTVKDNGVYQMDYNYLKSNGLSVQGAPINEIKVYGHGGAMLPEGNQVSRPGDIPEIAVLRQDNNSNGIFDEGDVILFYGESPHRWYFTPANGFYHKVNLYSDVNYYFISRSSVAGKSVSTAPTLNASNVVSSYDGLYFHENDQVNLIKSGREWMGEEFDRVLVHNFSVNFPGLITSEPIRLRTNAVGRANSNSSMTVTANGQQVQNINFSGIQFCTECFYTTPPTDNDVTFNSSQSSVNLSFRYNKAPGESKAWLNYYTLRVRQQLAMNGTQMHFRDSRSLSGAYRYEIANAPASLRVWNISNTADVIQMPLSISNGTATFSVQAAGLDEFIAFSETFLPTEPVLIQNQNLHGWGTTDYVIISAPEFLDASNRLADFHRSRGLRVNIATPQQVFNEFSSGKQDIAAIRDFIKMLYDKAAKKEDAPKYLLLMGRASYDYKARVKGNTNFVPTYQSKNSHSGTESYCSDDFFGFMDDNEGDWDVAHYLDVAVGRIPAITPAHANDVVNKIIGYSKMENRGDWQNMVAFIADDEDRNDHFQQADQLARIVETNYPAYYVNKIYIDAYKQISTGNGSRYPDAVRDINRIFNNGALVVNYSGHGGELGLAEESIVNIPQIQSWNNGHKLPLFVTATCEFSRYDDPSRISAGEWVLLNPNGGSIGMFTTVRVVFAVPNFVLNRAFYVNNAFELHNGRRPTIGETFLKSKNQVPGDNSRNFTLLGDPAMTLNYPELKVEITRINDKPAQGNPTVLKALSEVKIKGRILDEQGNTATAFNGTIIPSVFDKENTIMTLGNDPGSFPQPFGLFNRLLFRGEASVTAGEFEYQFIVPLDITYRDGNGKIFHFAKSDKTDAHGDFQNFIISGESDGVATDRQGPRVKVFMNDYNFRAGDITDENPLLLVSVFDSSGINTTGSGIGRDLIAFIDGDRSNPIVLNSYYKAKLDNFREGEIRYRLNNLSEGPHTITVRVWDVANNSAEGSTHFVVKKKADVSINNLINFPNPFKDYTRFQFGHNQSETAVDVKIEIFDMAGARIAELNEKSEAGSSGFISAEWHGTNAAGNRVSPGIYLYRAYISAGNNQSNMLTGRLVIVP